MTCNKASQLDAGAYLANPGAARWAEFRSHYTGCADCSRAVAEWSEFEQALRTEATVPQRAHIENANLARLAEDPGALSAELRTRIEGHLSGCVICSDKLGALQEFDFDALIDTTAPAEVGVLEGAFRSAGEKLRRLLAGSSPGSRDAFNELFPWRQPEVVFQSRHDMAEGNQATGSSPERGASKGILAVVEGDLAGQVYSVFDGENRIGRARHCEVWIPSDDLARVEATLTVSNGRFELSAAQDHRAPRINGEALRTSELRDGDLVELGAQQLRFRNIGAGGPT
jgi:hypothetical protein